jgi:hypothetical protein
MGTNPQSNELTRGPPELVQHFRLLGELTSAQSAACPKFDMVWLHRSSIPEGGGGISHTARIPSPLPLCVAKTGSNHLNEEFTLLLPTGIGERF